MITFDPPEDLISLYEDVMVQLSVAAQAEIARGQTPLTVAQVLHRFWTTARMQDDELRRAFQMTGGEPGDAEADSLAAELRRRHLDF